MSGEWGCRAAALAVLAALVPGCGGDSGDEGKKKKPAPVVREQSAGERGPTAPGASVRFVAPKSSSTTGSTVEARVRLTKFRLDPGAVGDKPQAGYGHLHFALDGGRYDRPPWSQAASGPLATKLRSTGKFTPATKPTVTYKRIPKGTHRLVVYLANNDGTNTDIGATTIFTVK